MEKISIIIPVYNSEATIEKCLDSVLNQTYRNLEVILVESASTDRSAILCDNISKKDNRVIVIHQPEKKGLSNARNEGLKVASGDYIGFVDSDDWISLTMYEHLYNALKETNADISFGQVERTSDRNYSKESGKLNVKKLSQNDFAKRFFRISTNKTVHYVWNKLYKAEIAHSIIFPEGSLAEDVDGFFQALLKANYIAEINETVYFYWYNENGLSSDWFSKKQMDIISVWKTVVERCHVAGKEEWYNWAELNYYRAFFGVLTRMCLSGKSTDFPEEKKYLIENTKQYYWKLLFSSIPLSRKILLTAFCMNYNFVESIYKFILHYKKGK